MTEPLDTHASWVKRQQEAKKAAVKARKMQRVWRRHLALTAECRQAMTQPETARGMALFVLEKMAFARKHNSPKIALHTLPEKVRRSKEYQAIMQQLP